MENEPKTSQELIDAHPDVFTPEIVRYGVPGWISILHELIVDLKALGWDKQILQVKNKFDGLRFYVNPGQSEEINKRISQAEQESLDYCWSCNAEMGKFVEHKKTCWTMRPSIPKTKED